MKILNYKYNKLYIINLCTDSTMLSSSRLMRQKGHLKEEG